MTVLQTWHLFFIRRPRKVCLARKARLDSGVERQSGPPTEKRSTKGRLMDLKITQHSIAGTKHRIKGICAGHWQAIMIQEEMIMPVGIA